jgi:hypothetical protein
MQSEARLFTMFAGWIIAIIGLGLAEEAMMIGNRELR